MKSRITTLFVDIGGVLGTNGWDRHSRKKAVETFQLDSQEFDARHKLYYDLLEKDTITLDQYLDQVVFYQPRSFAKEPFITFMKNESQPDWEAINQIRALKKTYNLHVSAISNESKFLAEYRIELFQLKSFIDDFFVSAFVYLQKPDPRIFELALNVLQVAPENILYLDDRPEHIAAAKTCGIHGVVYTKNLNLEFLINKEVIE